MRGRILEKLCSERSVMQIDGHSSVIIKKSFFTIKTPNVHVELRLMTYTVYFLQIILRDIYWCTLICKRINGTYVFDTTWRKN